MCQVGSGLAVTAGSIVSVVGLSAASRRDRSDRDRNGDKKCLSVVCAGGGLQPSSAGVSVWEVFV